MKTPSMKKIIASLALQADGPCDMNEISFMKKKQTKSKKRKK